MPAASVDGPLATSSASLEATPRTPPEGVVMAKVTLIVRTEMQSRPAVKRTRPRGYIETYRPQAKTLALLDDVITVLDEYREHWPLSDRQIFYRLVGPRYPKTDAFYTRLCEHIAAIERWLDLEQLGVDQALERQERQRIAYALPAPSGNGSHG